MRHFIDDNAEISRYLEQVANHPLLTREEEVALARIWSKRGAVPTYEQKAAYRELIRCNMKLVVSIAKGYRDRGLPFIDIIQEGVIGLGRAIDKFDPERGIKISTYGTWWIRQACQRAVASQGATIRVPAQVNFRRARTYQILEENPEATIEEIAKILECEVHHIEEALEVVRVSTSIDKNANGESEMSAVADVVADPNADDPADVVETRDFMRAATVHRVLDRISDEERAVIMLRFGFNGVHPHSFAEVSDALKIPTHRAQALQKTALRKLTHLLESDAVLSQGLALEEQDEEPIVTARSVSPYRRQAPTSAIFVSDELIEEGVLGRCDHPYESDVHEPGDIAC